MTDKRSPATEGDFRALPQETTPSVDFVYKGQDEEGNNKYISHGDLREAVKTTDVTATGGIKERIQETADGAQKTWTLQFDPDPVTGENVYAHSNGRLRSEYVVSGRNITFDDAPVANGVVDITSYAPAGGGGGAGGITSGANVGLAGVGFYDGVNLAGDTLNYRNIAAADSTILFTHNATSKTVQASVVQSSLILGSISGQINDSQHGTRAGGSLHANASGSSDGFMPLEDFTKLGTLDVNAQLPAGGLINQVAKKQSGTDFDVVWSDEAGGGGGHILYDNGGSALPQAPELQFIGGATAGSDVNRSLFDISGKADDSDLTAHTSDSAIHMDPQQVSDLASAAAHVPMSTNPHTVTKAQVGLGSAEDGAQINRALASQAQAEAGTDNTLGMTALRTAEAIAALGGGGPARSTGTAAMPSSISAGGFVDVVVSISGIALATHAVVLVHIPSTSTKIGWRAVAGTDQATVTLTNHDTSTISGLTGNITAKAEAI